jgi:hypothetical protein
MLIVVEVVNFLNDSATERKPYALFLFIALATDFSYAYYVMH